MTSGILNTSFKRWPFCSSVESKFFLLVKILFLFFLKICILGRNQHCVMEILIEGKCRELCFSSFFCQLENSWVYDDMIHFISLWASSSRLYLLFKTANLNCFSRTITEEDLSWILFEKKKKMYGGGCKNCIVNLHFCNR